MNERVDFLLGVSSRWTWASVAVVVFFYELQVGGVPAVAAKGERGRGVEAISDYRSNREEEAVVVLVLNHLASCVLYCLYGYFH